MFVVVELPEAILNSPLLLINLPNSVPSSFKIISAPPASSVISPALSNVIVLPSISSITGVVKVLFVSVSVVSCNTSVPVAFGMLTVLSAVGFTVVKVVSKLSGVPPSNTKAFCMLTVVLSTVVVVPETVKLPATVTLAPDIVIAVVADELDLITNSPPLLLNCPKIVPSSFNFISAPPASSETSPEASKVILVPLILLIVGVVKVLFVSVCVVFVPTNVVVASGIVTVLSAVGSATVNTVSKLSAVLPSKVIAPVVEIAPEVNVPANSTFAPSNVAAVVVPDFMIKLPDVFVKLP